MVCRCDVIGKSMLQSVSIAFAILFLCVTDTNKKK